MALDFRFNNSFSKYFNDIKFNLMPVGQDGQINQEIRGTVQKSCKVESEAGKQYRSYIYSIRK
jgi:hypothetical protein